ncbi:hypothetical protein [Wandonia haliotis]
MRKIGILLLIMNILPSIYSQQEVQIKKLHLPKNFEGWGIISCHPDISVKRDKMKQCGNYFFVSKENFESFKGKKVEVYSKRKKITDDLKWLNISYVGRPANSSTRIVFVHEKMPVIVFYHPTKDEMKYDDEYWDKIETKFRYRSKLTPMISELISKYYKGIYEP